MATSNVSVVLSQTDLDEIKTCIKSIDDKLPFLVNLPDEDVATLFKLGPKSADFVADALDTVNNYPQVLPPTFDKVEFTKDANLFKQLTELKMLLDSLNERVTDTYRQVGSEAMNSALYAYTYVKANENVVPGLKSVSDKLSDRFKKSKSMKQSLN